MAAAKSRYAAKNTLKNDDESSIEDMSLQDNSNVKQPVVTPRFSKRLQRKRSSSVVSTPSSKRSRSSQSPIIPLPSDNEDSDSPQESFFAEEVVGTPMNIDEETPNISKVSSKIRSLSETDERKVERLVRGFINVFVQNQSLWREFKEVVDSTSSPVTIPSIKGKGVQRDSPGNIMLQSYSQVTYL